MIVRGGRGGLQGRPEIFRTLGTVGLLLAVLAGCGSPEYHYVTNSADRTYVKIPSSWRPIDEKQLNIAFDLDPALEAADLGIWHVGYDADPAPTGPAVENLIGWQATAPAAFIGVRNVPPSSRGQYSLDGLRDLFFPVSPTARQRLATGAIPAAGFTDFALITDEVLTPGSGVRGVHEVFRYRMGGGPLQIIDQTVYLNDDASKLYMFFVRCSTECYLERQQEIESVVSSFTVRESS